MPRSSIGPAHEEVRNTEGCLAEGNSRELYSYQLSILFISILFTMSALTSAVRPCHPTLLDDELAALTLQLEEFGLASESSKGKHSINNPPDFEVAFSSFQAELEQYRIFLSDQKLAQSIGAAVHTDATVIGDITSQDVQAHEDRRYAVQLSNNDREIEAPPRHVDTDVQSNVEDWMSTVTSTIAAQSVVDFSDEEIDGGGPVHDLRGAPG